MNATYDTGVLAYWYGRSLTARAAYAQMGDFVARLRNLDAAFATLYVGHPRGHAPLHGDLSNLEGLLSAGINPEHGFINDDQADKSFVITSRSLHGFGGYFTNSKLERSQTIVLGVTCGQTLLPGRPVIAPNSVRLSVAPEIETPKLLRTLLEHTVEFWRPADAVVARVAIWRQLDQPVGEVKPGWLTYIADPSVSNALPPDIRHEPFADGVLIEAAERPGTEADPDFIASVLRVRDALRPKGFLNKRAALSDVGESVAVAR